MRASSSSMPRLRGSRRRPGPAPRLVAFVLPDESTTIGCRRPRPEPAADLESVDLREVQVEHDQVRSVLSASSSASSPSTAASTAYPLATRARFSAFGSDLVVDDEDAFLPQLSAPPSAEGSVNAERRSSSGRVLDPDVAVEQRDEPLADRETQSRPQAGVPVVHPVERIEELLTGLGRNAGPVVDHSDRHQCSNAGHRPHRLGSIVFDGGGRVLQEVAEDPVEEHGIGAQRRPRASGLDGDLAVLAAQPVDRSRTVSPSPRLRRARSEAPDPRHVQQVGDQRVQPVGLAIDRLECLAAVDPVVPGASSSRSVTDALIAASGLPGLDTAAQRAANALGLAIHLGLRGRARSRSRSSTRASWSQNARSALSAGVRGGRSPFRTTSPSIRPPTDSGSRRVAARRRGSQSPTRSGGPPTVTCWTRPRTSSVCSTNNAAAAYPNACFTVRSATSSCPRRARGSSARG